MQTDWQRFLVAQGAQFSNNQVTGFSASRHTGRSALDTATITPLTDLSVVAISGADAGSFLNAQFTTDLAKLKENQASLSAWCNPKGRVISNFYVFRSKAKYYVFLPTALKAEFCRRLQIYVLRAAVNIADKDAELFCLGLRGKHLDALTTQTGLASFPVNDRDGQRALVFGELAAMQALWQASSAAYLKTATQHWQVLNSLAGIAWIGNDSSEAYLPQELNLDLLDGLDFDKGCYPGQEIVARVHYRGRVKARTALALVSPMNPVNPVNHSSPPQTGTGLYVAGQEAAIGSVLNASHYEADHYLLLCVIARKCYDAAPEDTATKDVSGEDAARQNAGMETAGVIHLGAAKGPPLRPLPLPYAVPID